MRRRALLLSANALSLSRVVLAALYPLDAGAAWRVSLAGVAGATDFLDGWVARRTQTATPSGALIDAGADRVFVLVALTTWLLEGSLGLAEWGALLARDAATVLGFLVVRAVPSLRNAELRARWPGKLVTALQLATLVALPLARALVPALAAAVLAASVVAIADYAYALRAARRA